MSLRDRLLGGQEDGRPLDFEQMLEASLEELRVKQSAHAGVWHLGGAERWDLDQEVGDLVFTFADGVVAHCPAQIIGSHNSQKGTWMWAWANPCVVDALATDSRRVRAYGEEHGIEELTVVKLACDEAKAWAYTAFACALCAAQGAYRGPAGPLCVFMTFGQVSLSKP